MAKVNEDSEFPIAKALREKIFKIPLLPQDQIIKKFRQIDQLLYQHTVRLTEHIPMLRGYFVDIVHRVASGNTLGKNYFNKQDREDTDKKKKRILKKSELRILAQTYPLLRHQHNPQRFCQVLLKADFMRGVMEEALELFLDTIGDFEELDQKLRESAKSGSLEYFELERQHVGIRERLKFHDTESLLRLIGETEEVWNHYLELREQTISPYYRQVYSLAKSTASSDAQALDNFQNGIFGLHRAFKCYTPSRFAAFSLVAKDWINQSIRLNLKSEVNFIKLPIANWHFYQKLEKVRISIENRTNREVTMEEIAIAAKTQVEKVKKIYENVKLSKVLSLNVPTQNEEEQSDQPSWAFESVENPYNIEEILEFDSEFNIVRDVVGQFDDEERVIFGFISGCLDLIQNADLDPLEVERERMRQKAARVGIGVMFKRGTQGVE